MNDTTTPEDTITALTARIRNLESLAQRVVEARHSTSDNAWDEMKDAVFNLEAAIR